MHRDAIEKLYSEFPSQFCSFSQEKKNILKALHFFSFYSPYELTLYSTAYLLGACFFKVEKAKNALSIPWINVLSSLLRRQDFLYDCKTTASKGSQLSSAISHVLAGVWDGRTGAHQDSHWAACWRSDLWRTCRGAEKGALHEGGKAGAKMQSWECTDLSGDKEQVSLATAHSGGDTNDRRSDKPG